MTKKRSKDYGEDWGLLPDLDDLVGQARKANDRGGSDLRELEEHLDSLPNAADAFDYEDSMDDPMNDDYYDGGW